MNTITLLFVPSDEKLAAQIRADLDTQGYNVHSDIQPNGLTIAVLSSQAIADSDIRQSILKAIESHQHIVPVLANPVQVPRLIENLPVLDFSTGYDGDALNARLHQLTAPDAPAPLMVLTPNRQKSNRKLAVSIFAVIFLMFVLAILGVISGALVPPADEFAGVETQIFLTRNYFIDESLPRNTEEALSFELTVEQARETVQPFLILTATGIAGNAESTFYPRSTEEATNFPATLERVSTLVQERMAATVTELAVSAEAITPTPED
jgi:hypothetical protein